MNVNNISIQVDDAEYGTEYVTFNSWIYGIMRSGFGTPSMAELNAYTEQLKVVYEKITYEKGGSRYFSSKYNKKLVEANIRKAFCDKTDFNTTEELIPEEANLLNIANFTSEIYADNLDDYYPRQNVVENIMDDDKGKLKVDKKTQQLIDLAIETGNDRIVLELQQRVSSHPNKNRSFHYLPYRTDSGFEQTFLREVLSFDIIEKLGLAGKEGTAFTPYALAILAAGCIILFIVSVLQERGMKIRESLAGLSLPITVAIYFCLLASIGFFGSTAVARGFIYAQF